MSNVIKYYKKGELEVVWQPGKCTHSAVCATTLAEVFNPNKRPWVNMDGSDAESIAKTVRSCPSGALSLKGDETVSETATNPADPAVSIKLLENGPLLVSGELAIILTDGTEQKILNPALCRCGASANKPFCDGSHIKANFKG